MSVLRLTLLGPPHAELDGRPMEVDTRKAIALLAYLAMNGHDVSRESAAALLWPDYDQSRAHGALRRTLSALRKALGSSAALRVNRTSLRVEPGELDLDAARFRKLAKGCGTHPASPACDACASALQSAAECYTGEFLSGFALRDAPDFDDWQFRMGEDLRRELGGVLDRLVSAYARRGDLDLAIDAARRWLALDRLHEPAHRELIRLYASAGNRAAALRQYRECVGVLDAELGVAPLEETSELYRALREGRLTDRSDHPHAAADRSGEALGDESVGPAERPRRYPMVGRSSEWTTIVRAYEAVAAGDGHLVVLEGEAGIGKTRLATELLAHTAARGASVITARCYEEESALAFAPVAEVLHSAYAQRAVAERMRQLPDTVLAESSRLLPEVRSADVAPLDSPGTQARFFEALADTLQTACAGSVPGVLFVDDLQWADDASLDAFTYLVRRLNGRRMVVLGTWRTEDVPADHRLRALAVQCSRDRSGTIVELGRLTEGDVESLVRAAGVAPPDGDLIRRLHAETEGVAFFVVEYLAAMDPDWGLPTGVRDLLRVQVSRVSETSRQVLTAAAVIGRSFDAETLRAVSGRGEDETATALEELCTRGIIDGLGGAFDFRHEKVRSFVYGDAGLPRRRLLHRRVAHALAARARRGRDAVPHALVANHYASAGREREAAEQYRRAGLRARDLYANAEALTHFTAAVAYGHPDVGELHEAIGDLLTLRADYRGAIASYEAALAQATATDAAVLEHKLGNVRLRQGEWEAAAAHFKAALDAGPSPAARARIRADLGLAAQRSGHPDEALADGREALAAAQEAQDPTALAQSHNLLGLLSARSGALDDARDHLAQSLAIADEIAAPAARVAALNNLALVIGASGDAAAALELAERALELCRLLGDLHREAAIHSNIADFLRADGRLDEAKPHQLRAAALFSEVVAAEELQPEIWKLVDW